MNTSALMSTLTMVLKTLLDRASKDDLQMWRGKFGSVNASAAILCDMVMDIHTGRAILDRMDVNEFDLLREAQPFYVGLIESTFDNVGPIQAACESSFDNVGHIQAACESRDSLSPTQLVNGGSDMNGDIVLKKL